MAGRTLIWINPNDHAQMQWIITHLADKGLWGYVPQSGQLLTSHERVEQFRTLYLAGSQKNAHPEAVVFTMAMQKIRNAWQQRQYRQTKGRQYSFQLPQEVVKDLKLLTQQRGDSQVQVVRDVITEAAQDQLRIKEVRQACRQETAKLQQNHNDAQHTLRHMLDQMLDVLAQNLHALSRLEAQVGGPDERGHEALDENTQADYRRRINAQVTRSTNMISDLKTQHRLRKKLQQRIDKLTPVS